MKKLTAVLLVLSLLFLLAACGDKPSNPNGISSDSTVPDTTASDTASDTTGANDTTVSTDTEKSTESPTTSEETNAPKETTPPSTDAPKRNNDVPKETTSPATNPPTVAPCSHSNTEVRNKKDATTSAEGYTGDTYCKNCGKLISSGNSVPKIKQTVSVSHDYYDIEMQIFNEINAERTKAGLTALVWDENLYAGTKVRVKEFREFIEDGTGVGPHNRPDGREFYTAIEENSSYSMYSFSVWGENCGAITNYTGMTNMWMNSTGHRENILASDYTKCAIAICYYNNTYFAANVFAG